MKRVILSATLLFWSASALFAQIINPDVNIRFYNKKIYTPDSAVEILVELENKTENPIAFLSADNKIYNIKVKAATLQGVLCEPSDLYLKTMAIQEPYQYKEIILQPNESYSFRIVLADYVVINQADSYKIEVLFFGQLSQNPGEAAVSNPLFLNIGEAESTQEEILTAAEETVQPSSAAARRSAMEPDRVVAFTIDALMNKKNDDFFLYIDLESLYLKNAERKDLYMKGSEEVRNALLNEYRRKITEGNAEREFVLIPNRYEISLTTYTATNAQVTVIEFFDRVTFTEKKEYKYRLEKKDSVWRIKDYAVRNLGIEK